MGLVQAMPRRLSTKGQTEAYNGKVSQFNAELCNLDILTITLDSLKSVNNEMFTNDGVHLTPKGCAQLVRHYKTALNPVLGLKPYNEYTHNTYTMAGPGQRPYNEYTHNMSIMAGPGQRGSHPNHSSHDSQHGNRAYASQRGNQANQRGNQARNPSYSEQTSAYPNADKPQRYNYHNRHNNFGHQHHEHDNDDNRLAHMRNPYDMDHSY